MRYKNVFLVWYRSFFVFKNNLLNSTILLLTEPVLSMLAFGVGIGSLIDKVNGMTYLEFYFIGRLSNTALIATYFKSTNGFFNKIHLDGVYASASIAGVTPKEMFWGEIIWITCRTMYIVLLSWFIFCLLGLGAWSAIAVTPILIIDTFIVAAIGMSITVSMESSNSFFFSNIGFVVPLSLFSGAFFPIENLPKVFYYIALAFPQANVISLCRNVMAGRYFTEAALLQSALILAYLVVTVWLAQRLFIKNIKK